MLEEHQIKEIKKQLIEQINSTFPEDKKESAIEKVELMDGGQLEEFLIQNNLVKEKNNDTKCIFCIIKDNKVNSYKIGENNEAIAILEINPISNGHTIIIPKDHEQKEISDTIIKLSNDISKRIKSKLKPKEIDISESSLFGHKILNIIPVYSNENINSKRTKANPDKLKELQEELTKQEPEIVEERKEEPKKEINEQNTWLPRRIP
jgi:histidine triad (HIT) family protein